MSKTKKSLRERFPHLIDDTSTVVPSLGDRVVKVSGRRRLDPLPPEPTYPSPLKLPKPPFAVRFIVVNDKKVEEGCDNNARIIGNFHSEARRRLETHFGGFNRVEPDGRLRFYAGSKKPLTLKFDFGIVENSLYGIKLPKEKVPIEKLESGYTCEAWRLVVIRRRTIRRMYADFIIFEDGHFYLKSLKYPKK